MSLAHNTRATCIAGAPEAPRAVSRIAFGDGEPIATRATGGRSVAVACRSGERAVLVAVRVTGARGLDAADLRSVARAAYGEVRGGFARLPGARPVRFWNHIPGIGETLETGLDRYRIFNMGRRDALVGWLTREERECGSIPAATGVGHAGDDLVLHGLAMRGPVRSIENPRQCPACRYSERHGPVPPLFARGTVVSAVDGSRVLLAGGTASVRGEDSRHAGDLEGQLVETIENLGALVREARSGAGHRDDPLRLFTSLRVYHREAADRDALRALVGQAFPAVACFEWIVADLCRPELLVEIEGTAALS